MIGTVQAGDVEWHMYTHFCWNFKFFWGLGLQLLPFFLLINLILYLHQDVYMYSDTGTNQIFVAFVGKFRDNSGSGNDQSFGFLFVDLE